MKILAKIKSHSEWDFIKIKNNYCPFIITIDVSSATAARVVPTRFTTHLIVPVIESLATKVELFATSRPDSRRTSAESVAPPQSVAALFCTFPRFSNAVETSYSP